MPLHGYETNANGLRCESNEAWSQSTGHRLSVLVPFRDYDVSELARRLVREAITLPAGSVELLFADDASRDAAGVEPLRQVLASAGCPAMLLTLAENRGRSGIRNLLTAAARGDALLFIDSDMLPDAGNYLGTYLRHASQDDRLIIYGGRSYRQLRCVSPDRRLYHYLSSRTECRPAAERQRAPEWYAFTNNLLVPRAVFERHSFDEAFSGWGFEDTDWNLRASRDGRILHIDNEATHMGLIADAELLAKYEESTGNFRLLLQRHPVETGSFPVTRAARRLASMPWLSSLLQPAARKLALWRALPLVFRYVAVQIYRACLYSGVIREKAAA